MSYVEYNNRRIEIIDNKLSLRDQRINDIKEIKGLSKLADLITLNLEENNINKIEGLENLINLENLFLSKNQITKIEGRFLKFDCSNC